MGNEQSSSPGAPASSSSSSTFAFLSNRASVRKGRGIVTVSDGTVKQSTIDEDEIYKRFKEIPRFLPILPNSVGKKEVDSHPRMNSRPIFKLATRLQEHLVICGRTVSTDQAALSTAMKKIEKKSEGVSASIIVKKASMDQLETAFANLPRLRDDVMKIQLLLEELVPVAETLNELLLPADRLPHLNLKKVLIRTPVTSSDSSLQSTPRRQPVPIECIEEIKVVDRS